VIASPKHPRRCCLFRWLTRVLVASLIGVVAGQAAAAGPETNSAAALRARYADLGQQLSGNQFHRPIVLDSAEFPARLQGEIYALLDYPFAGVSAALTGPAHWCDVLILHLNTQYCHAPTDKVGSLLVVSIGKKSYQELDETHLVEFAYHVATTTPEYFDVSLNAKTGPMGTSDYLIGVQAVAVQGGKTFLHLTYSYAYGFVGSLAMQTYLATLGSGKVGFTRAGKQSDGQPDYIGGVRGVVERNTMRYYLAIDAYLGALSAPPSEQLDKRLQSWFTATEFYPRQLHEVDRAAYLDMKRRELLRMQTLP
jgi:hypothetical protein